MKQFFNFKLLFLTFLILLFSDIYIQAQDSDPLMVVTIMVKNEEHCIEKTLEPFLRLNDPRIGYLILDTGSTDNTVHVTLEAFKKYGVLNGYLFEKPFVNFAVSRNDALKYVEQQFPHAAFLLMIDAEWYVQNVPELLEFCEQYKNTEHDSFFLKIGTRYFENFSPKLLRPNRGLCFQGAVHEYLKNAHPSIKIPQPIWAFYDPSSQGLKQSKQRFHRDVQILHDEYLQDTKNYRATFHLAQTYACLGDFENALYWYKVRTEQQSASDQENYMAWYRIAQTYQFLGDWPNALCNYIKAYNMRPWRVEPLVAIAQYYMCKEDYAAAFMFARMAVDTEQRDDEILFVDTVFYDVTRYAILGISAWYVGQYEIGQKALLQAYERDPDAEGVQFFLSLYEYRKN